jgi:uncharacterized protein involved in exopolysaccharide biosynthesis
MNSDKVDYLDVLTADAQESISKLVALRREVEIRKSLLESFLARYAAAVSVVSIDGDSDIGNIDGDGICEVEGVRSVLDLATG